MNTETPHLSEKSQNRGDRPPKKPLEQIQAEHEANKLKSRDNLNAFSIEEEKTQRMADITLCIENDWDFCGIEPKSNETLQALGEIFYQKEQGKGADYDITKLPPKMARKFAEKGMKDRVNRSMESATEIEEGQTEIEQEKQTVTTKNIDGKATKKTEIQEGEKTGFFEAVKDMKGDNASKLSAIAQMTEKYPEEAVKAGKFLQILSVASANKQDSQIITQKLNQADFSKGVPDPVQFVR